jgi:uncharacterized protein YcfJ
MGQITIQGIDPDIEQKIRWGAKRNGQSINQFLKGIIHQEFGKGRRKPRANSIKKLAGGWCKNQADVFETSISACEQIDEDMWR